MYDDGARKTRWTTRGYEQTAMVQCTLWPTVAETEVWPKTNYEWYEVWPNPPETTEAEVDTMLDNIDLDFDQSQTTFTKQKYTNCTNDIKSALKGHAAAIEYYSGAFYQSPLNPDGTESKVWIELLEKAKLGRNYVWEAASAFPGLKGVSKTWDTYNTNDLTHSLQMEQLRYDSCLFYRFEPSQGQVEEKAGRHINDFLVIGLEPNVERFLAQAQGKLNLQDIVRLYKTGDEGRLSAMNLRKLEKGYELQDKPFLIHEIAADLKIENAKTSLIPESISQKPQDDNDQLPTPSDTRILRTYVDKAMYLGHQRPDIQHSVNTFLRSMRNPTMTTIQKLKKLTSYLLGMSNVYQKSNTAAPDNIEGLGALQLAERMAIQNSDTTFEIHRARLQYVSDDRMS